MLHGSDALFHINLRGWRATAAVASMLTGTLHVDASGQSGGIVHSLECIHAGG